MMSVFFIDGSGWNGKESRAIVTDEHGNILDSYSSTKPETNNEMEYRGLIIALKLAKSGDQIFTDSKLIEGQVVKNWKCNYPHLQLLKNECILLLETKDVQISWKRRNENIAGKVFEGKLNKVSIPRKPKKFRQKSKHKKRPIIFFGYSTT